MSFINKNLVEKNLYEIEFDASVETFNAAVDRAFKKNGKNINVPGFRKGKAPRPVIEKMYGKGVFYEDAINDIIGDAYAEAVKESGLNPVSRPEYDVDTIDENGVKFKAKFYVKPEVSISGYTDVPVTKYVAPVTDEDVSAEIKKTQERNSRTIDVEDRPAENGDTTDIDYLGTVDGVPFDGGAAEHHSLKLGSGQFIPGFEEQIVGHAIGEEFDVNVIFPEEYHSAELAGKAAVFHVKLHGIKATELPALDDEFAKDVSDFDNFAAYSDDVKAKLAEKNEKAAETEIEGQIIDALINNIEADIPEPMFENETENFLRDYDNRLRMQGLDLQTYMKYTGMELDTLRAQFRPQAERQVKTRLALEKIAELEGIAATDEEIAEEYETMAKAYGMETEKVKELVEADALAEDIKVKKAVDFVRGRANVTVSDKPVVHEHHHDEDCDCDDCNDDHETTGSDENVVSDKPADAE